MLARDGTPLFRINEWIVVPYTRHRAHGFAAAAIACLLVLTGCSGTASDTKDDAGAVSIPEAEGATSYPLALESPYGETVLTERPERIAVVTASTVDTDALLALGVTPVLAPTTIERNTWLDDADVAGIGTLWESEAGAEASAETVAASKPDLIINLYAYETFDQAQYDKMSAIAPILYAEAEELSWQEITLLLGETLDLAKTAETAIADAEGAVAQLRADNPAFEGKTVTQVMVYPEKYGASYNTAPGFSAAPVFEALGFVSPEVAEKFVEDDVISDELIGLIDADFVLISTGSANTAETDYFTQSPLLQAIPAFADGRVVIDPADPETGINDLSWGINVPSALSVPWVSERIVMLATDALSDQG